MGFRIVVNAVLMCVVHGRTLFVCLVVPTMLAIAISAIALTLFSGSAWRAPVFWFLVMNQLVTYFEALLLVLLLILFVAQSFVAVAWHRFILRGEQPALTGPYPLETIWRYLLLSVLVGFIYTVVTYVIAVFASAFAPIFGILGNDLAELVLTTGIGTFLAYVVLRIGLILPATAVDETMTLGQSWEISGRYNAAFLEIALVLNLIAVALDILLGFLDLGWTALAITSLSSSLLVLVLSLSVLTTLYSAVVEGNDLSV